MSNNLGKLVIVVNGISYDVKANVEAPVLVVIEKALDESGNKGQPPQNWGASQCGWPVARSSQEA